MGLNWFKKKKEPENYTPDFNHVDSMEKAVKLYKKGELTKLFIIAPEFGGEDSHLNVVYVPEEINTIKRRCDAMLENFLLQDKKIEYNIQPSYRDNSVIPVQLHIVVSGDVDFEETIKIW